jgi:hypothetical protein
VQGKKVKRHRRLWKKREAGGEGLDAEAGEVANELQDLEGASSPPLHRTVRVGLEDAWQGAAVLLDLPD